MLLGNMLLRLADIIVLLLTSWGVHAMHKGTQMAEFMHHLVSLLLPTLLWNTLFLLCM